MTTTTTTTVVAEQWQQFYTSFCLTNHLSAPLAQIHLSDSLQEKISVKNNVPPPYIQAL